MENYLQVLEESLYKKLDVLDRIEKLGIRQEQILNTIPVSEDDFDSSIEEKGRLIDELGKLDEAILRLRKGEKLPAALRDHELQGVYKGNRECHIEPDWLLIYRVNDEAIVLTAVRTGSHSDLF